MDSMIIHSDYSVDNSPNFLQNLEQKSKATASEYTEESKNRSILLTSIFRFTNRPSLTERTTIAAALSIVQKVVKFKRRPCNVSGQPLRSKKANFLPRRVLTPTS